MNADNIPKELKELNQWVCAWGTSKVPMQAYKNKAASATKPETWSSFDMALFAVNRGWYDNLGFVFADNGIVGIDIDCGFDSNGITELCREIIGACKSYTEKSRSGRGVHILLKGTLPFKGKNNGAGVEIYQSGRYFLVTGDMLDYSEVIENQSAIDYVIDKYFPETEKESNTEYQQRIYSPVFGKPENGRINIRPKYPPITSGSRNLSLTSLAGQMHTQGYDKSTIYRELLYANREACKPPLFDREIESIVNSVTRYRR